MFPVKKTTILMASVGARSDMQTSPPTGLRRVMMLAGHVFLLADARSVALMRQVLPVWH